MKFIIDTYPYYCPGCGYRMRSDDDKRREYQIEDFSSCQSSVCDCGAKFQFVRAENIETLAKACGDW